MPTNRIPRAAPARSPQQLFISHISEEAGVALALQAMLQELFGGAVEVFTSSDTKSIEAGANWLEVVQSALEQASALIVLCSKASVSRPWVQFELGAAWMEDIPIIPVCHSGMKPADLPMPLSLRNATAFTPEGVERLYRAVAERAGCTREPDPAALARHLQALQEAETGYRAQPLVQFETAIDILVPPPGRLAAPLIPPEAVVELSEESSRLFGYLGGPLTWRQIQDAAARIKDQRWLKELQWCVMLAGNGKSFRPVQAIYHGPEGSYQPQLSKRETLPDGTCRYHVHFVETVVAPLAEVDNDFGLLATLMRLGLRFRYEVIEKCGRDLRVKMLMPGADAAAATAEVRQLLRGAVERIENDALSRGAQNFDRASVLDLFEDEADQRAVSGAMLAWDAARASLFATSPEPGLADMQSALEAMREFNYTFMVIGSRRYHEMIERAWKPPGKRA